MKKSSGFTLIEMIVAVIILSILTAVAAPKFFNFREDALQAKVKNFQAAFKRGVDLAHYRWIVDGASLNINDRNDLQVIGGSPNGQLDFNENGYPTQSEVGVDPDPIIDSETDCLSLWKVLMETTTELAAIGSDHSLDIFILYESSDNTCEFKLSANEVYGFSYDAVTGKVESI